VPTPDPIQLPDFLIANLYRHSLVILDDEQRPGETATPVSMATAETATREWYLGSNLQKITLVVIQKDAVYVNDESLRFLSNILGACKLNLGDVAIVNYHTEPVNYTFLKENTSPQHLILFGITAQQIQLPFTIPNYQVQKYDNCNFLIAGGLEMMLGDNQEAKLEKSKLWLSLKKMFNV
jgi:hypothetical protein